MGVDSRIFSVEIGLVAIFVILQMWVFFPTVFILHLLARWAHNRDDRMVEASFKYAKEHDFWDPWHQPKTTDNRPKGFGKGLPL